MADKKTQRSGSGTVKPKDAPAHPENKLTIEVKEDLEHIKNLKCLSKFFVITFSILAVITALVAVTVIATSTLAAIAAGSLDAQDTSGRLVALIILAVTAAVTVASVVYAQVAVCTKKIRPIVIAAVVLILLAFIQLIIACASVRVTEKDQVHINQVLAESFQLARQHSVRNMKTWAMTQSSLHCCGLYSPFDYRVGNTPPYMPPDVPISCCPAYDPNRSELVQEREREICKARNEYYETGCSGQVLEVITESSKWAFTTAVTLIIFEFITAVFGGLVVKKRKELHKKSEDPEHHDNNDPHK